MKEMKQYTIADVCSRLSSGKGIPASKVTPIGPYPVIGGNGVRGYTDSFNFDGECAIIGRQGANCGNVRYFQGKAYMTEHAIVAIGNENANTKYLACLFSLMHLGNLSAQSAQPGLSVQTLSKQIVYLPEINTQNQIADIIKSLDAKIEINKQINDNLEQQAQAAFNNIVAKYSECETINLSEIAALNPKRTIAKGTLARSIEMAQLPTSGSFPAGWDLKDYNGGMKFQNGDTLMARITPCLENGKVAYINFLEENEVAFGSTEYIVIASRGAIAPEVFYFLTRYNDFVDFAVKNMNGSSGRQRVSAETIGTYKLPVISPEDMVILETIAKEALNKIKYNSLENIRLSEIRDTLLPKLMSGELKINEIDC